MAPPASAWPNRWRPPRPASPSRPARPGRFGAGDSPLGATPRRSERPTVGGGDPAGPVGAAVAPTGRCGAPSTAPRCRGPAADAGPGDAARVRPVGAPVRPVGAPVRPVGAPVRAPLPGLLPAAVRPCGLGPQLGSPHPHPPPAWATELDPRPPAPVPSTAGWGLGGHQDVSSARTGATEVTAWPRSRLTTRTPVASRPWLEIWRTGIRAITPDEEITRISSSRPTMKAATTFPRWAVIRMPRTPMPPRF